MTPRLTLHEPWSMAVMGTIQIIVCHGCRLEDVIQGRNIQKNPVQWLEIGNVIQIYSCPLCSKLPHKRGPFLLVTCRSLLMPLTIGRNAPPKIGRPLSYLLGDTGGRVRNVIANATYHVTAHGGGRWGESGQEDASDVNQEETQTRQNSSHREKKFCFPQL